MAASNYLSTKSENELKAKGKHKHYKDPRKAGLATLIFFLIIGFIPLLSFVIAAPLPFVEQYKFHLSFVLTGIALLAVGAFKGQVVGKHSFRSAVETLLVGGAAAFIAFAVGYLLRGLVG